MAQSKGRVIENTFGQGYITEATGLNFPKNAASNVQNVWFSNRLSVSKRLGFDYETAPLIRTLPSYGHTANFQWRNVGGTPDINYTVIQMGEIIYFYDNSVDANSLSNNFISSVELNPIRTAGAPDCALDRCQFAEGRGQLFITHPSIDPLVATYNQFVLGTLEYVQYKLQVRDFDGIDEVIANDFRPLTLTNVHNYNIFNQGWSVDAPCGDDQHIIGPSTAVMGYFFGAASAYPSNADYWWGMKDALDQLNDLLVNVNPTGNTPAPKGHYVLEAFNQDRSTVSGISGIAPVTSGYHRPSCVAFFAGRVFYAGVRFNSKVYKFGSKIYFSRIIEKDEHIFQCYQDGDPTAENGADLLASDGGVIESPDIGTIYKMFPLGYSLIIFASNGVWSISGSTGSGFTAKDYSIAKISTVGMISDNSFVDVDGTPMWWSSNGIYTLGAMMNTTNASAGVNVSSVTDTTIKSFIKNLPDYAKLYASGTYDRINNIIYWLYKSAVPVTLAANYAYDNALVLNTVTKAFSKWTLPNVVVGNTVNKFISGVFTIQLTTAKTVTKFILTDFGAAPNFTFAEYKSTVGYDFSTLDYPTFVESGYAIDGQGITKFRTPYVFIYLDSRIGGSLNFYHKWNFANSPDTGKFSNLQSITAATGYDYNTIRKKVRGSGRALVIRFEGLPGVMFELVGWAIAESGNGSP